MGSIAFSSALVLGSEPDDAGSPTISIPFVDSQGPHFDRDLEELIRAAPVAAAIPLFKALDQPQRDGRVPLSPGPNRWFTDLEVR
jgi:hypothetical protein